MFQHKKKAIQDSLEANIILIEERQNVFPPRSGTRQGSPLSPHIFNILIILEFLANQAREKKVSKLERKKEVKLSLFTDDMILY